MDRGFYIWTMAEVIKETYEQWGIDLMSMWKNIQESFPNAAKAVKDMYSEFDENTIYEARGKQFDNPECVYQAVANLIPAQSILQFDVSSTAHFPEYENLRVYGWNKMTEINRIDLIAAIMLFAEEFTTMSLDDEKVIFTREKLIVQDELITFKVVKHQKRTIVNINIHGVVLLVYEIAN